MSRAVHNLADEAFQGCYPYGAPDSNGGLGEQGVIYTVYCMPVREVKGLGHVCCIKSFCPDRNPRLARILEKHTESKTAPEGRRCEEARVLRFAETFRQPRVLFTQMRLDWSRRIDAERGMINAT